MAEIAATAGFPIHRCGPGDRAEQAELFNACFSKRVEPRHLVWRYDQSPHGGSFSFVRRSPEGQAVCGYACSPRRAVSFGREETLAPLGQTGDVMTHPGFRKRGLFSELDRVTMAATREAGWPAVFGLPNRRSAHIFLELGWDQVGRIRPWSFLLSAAPGVRARRLREGRLAAWRTPLDVWRCGRMRRRLAARAEKGLEVAVLERFGPEAEALARALEPRFALMVRRDEAYLNWRFIDTPSKRQRALGLWDPKGALAAYVVVQPPAPGEVVGHLVDLVARDAAAEGAALLAGLLELERAGAGLVEASAVDGSHWQTLLALGGFLPPRPENHLIVILHPHDREHPLTRAGADASGWYLTDGDRDDETIG